jgi:DNA adenine methylase
MKRQLNILEALPTGGLDGSIYVLGDKPQKPIADHFGQKWSLGKWIISHLPLEHECYVEPFGGFFNVGLQKPKVPVEIYSDLNFLTVNLLKHLQHSVKELMEGIKAHKQEFGNAQGAFDDCVDVLWGENWTECFDKAVAYYLYAQLSYSGAGTRWSSGTTRTQIEKARRCDDEHLWVISNRIQDLDIRHKDAFSLIPELDSEETLFYVDPPYEWSVRGCKDNRTANPVASAPRKQYAHELDAKQHRELGELLLGCRGKVVISGYRSDLYAELYEARGWMRFDKKVGHGIESIWVKPHKSQPQIIPLEHDAWDDALFGHTDRQQEPDGQLAIFYEPLDPPDPDDYPNSQSYESAWAEWEVGHPDLAQAIDSKRSGKAPLEHAEVKAQQNELPLEHSQTPEVGSTDFPLEHWDGFRVEEPEAIDITKVLAELGFNEVDIRGYEPLDCDEEYRGWKIYLPCPNGGILGADLTSPDERVFCCITEFPGPWHFDYNHYEGILGHAKRAIDATFPPERLEILEAIEHVEKAEFSKQVEWLIYCWENLPGDFANFNEAVDKAPLDVLGEAVDFGIEHPRITQRIKQLKGLEKKARQAESTHETLARLEKEEADLDPDSVAPLNCWIERAKCHRRKSFQCFYRSTNPIFNGKKRKYIGMDGLDKVKRAYEAVKRRDKLVSIRSQKEILMQEINQLDQ